MVSLLLHFDLVIATLVSVVMALLTLLMPGSQSPLTITLGLLMVLITPGYVLVAALFPKRYVLHAGARIALSVGLSFVIVATLGFLLSGRWGIRPTTVATGLAVITLVLAVIAVMRRLPLAPEAQFALFRFPLEGVELRRVWVVLGSLCLLGTALAFAVTFNRKVAYTEFYVLGPDGDLTGYPLELAAGEDISLIFGIANKDSAGQTYRLEQGGTTSAVLLAEPSVEQGETWEEPIVVTAPPLSGESRLEFNLYRQGDVTPYRSLYFLVTVGNPAEASQETPEDVKVQKTAVSPN